MDLVPNTPTCCVFGTKFRYILARWKSELALPWDTYFKAVSTDLGPVTIPPACVGWVGGGGGEGREGGVGSTGFISHQH